MKKIIIILVLVLSPFISVTAYGSTFNELDITQDSYLDIFEIQELKDISTNEFNKIDKDKNGLIDGHEYYIYKQKRIINE